MKIYNATCIDSTTNTRTEPTKNFAADGLVGAKKQAELFFWQLYPKGFKDIVVKQVK